MRRSYKICGIVTNIDVYGEKVKYTQHLVASHNILWASQAVEMMYNTSKH